MNQIPFRIIELNVESFHISKDILQEDTPIEVRTNYEFGVNPDKHIVMAKLTYNYVQNEKSYLTMILVSSFDVEEKSFTNMIHDNTFILEPFFSRYISTINVGAARGEIHARCELGGSVLSKVILPPINLVEALPNQVNIPLH